MCTSIGLGNVALHDYTGFSLCHSCDLVWKINWSEDLLKSGGVTVLIQEPLPWRKSYFWGKENCNVGTRAHLCLYAGVHMQTCEHICGRVCTWLWVCTHKCMCFDSPLCGCVWTYVRVYLCSPTPCRYPNIHAHVCVHVPWYACMWTHAFPFFCCMISLVRDIL